MGASSAFPWKQAYRIAMIYLPREWQLVAGGLHAAAFCRRWLTMIHQICAYEVHGARGLRYMWATCTVSAACCAGRTPYLAAGCAVIAVIVAKCLFKYRRLPPHRRRCRRAVYLLIFLLSPLQLHAASPRSRHAARRPRSRERPLAFCFPAVCDATTVVYFAR